MDCHPSLRYVGGHGVAGIAARTFSFQPSSTHKQVNTMLLNILGFQKLLDALFDTGWCTLGLPEGDACGDMQPAE
jgi:hypothetical protein